VRLQPISRPDRQAGFSQVVDLLLMLGGVLAILAVGYAIWHMWQGSFTVTKAATNVQHMATDAQSSWSQQGDFQGINATSVINLHIPPKSMVHGNQIINAWNQPVSVNPYTLTTPNDAAEWVEPGVPESDCGKFVTSAASGFSRVIVGGTTVKDDLTGQALSIAALANACSGGGTKTVHLIVGRQ